MSRVQRRPASASGRWSRGQTLVEFALVAPIFFLVLFGIIEGGRFIYHYEMVNAATREGARYAIIHGSNAPDGCISGPMLNPPPPPNCYDAPADRVRQAVRDAALGPIGDGGFTTINVTYPQGDNDRGSPVRVDVVFTYSPILAVLPTITITAESNLVINN